jgi:hypothetical protein
MRARSRILLAKLEKPRRIYPNEKRRPKDVLSS